uniref:Uncharacterized protein n=1 Tax=Zooxanthella nutricula TaxID=1333877 RepID=A0A7S2I3C0_9DINO
MDMRPKCCGGTGMNVARLIVWYRRMPDRVATRTTVTVAARDAVAKASHPESPASKERYENAVRSAANAVRIHASKVRSLDKSVDRREKRSRLCAAIPTLCIA